MPFGSVELRDQSGEGTLIVRATTRACGCSLAELMSEAEGPAHLQHGDRVQRVREQEEGVPQRRDALPGGRHAPRPIP